jgi:hypothetical protein
MWGFPSVLKFLEVGWDWVHLVRRPLIGLLYPPRMIDDEYGPVGGIRIGRGNRSTWRKPVPMPLCPPQIPHHLTRDGTQAAAVGSRRLTAWAMACTGQMCAFHWSQMCAFHWSTCLQPSLYEKASSLTLQCITHSLTNMSADWLSVGMFKVIQTDTKYIYLTWSNFRAVKSVLNGPFIKRNFVLNGNIFRSRDFIV